MKYFIDSEFIDDGKTIDLISIGIVAEDGREYYAQDCTCELSKASPWVKGNVIPHLQATWKYREQIVRDILSFTDVLLYGKPELWGWCCAYDFVAFCQLFGTMMDLPNGYPYYMRDFQHVLDERGIADAELPEQAEGLHNALADASHLKRLWGYIVRNDCWQ